MAQRVLPLFALLVLAAHSSACGNDNPLYPTTSNTSVTPSTTATTASTSTPGNACGTGAATIGYAANAAAVLNQYCVTSCHVAGGTFASLPMDTYANASASLSATNISIVGQGMPPLNAPQQMNATQVCILQTWVQDGDGP